MTYFECTIGKGAILLLFAASLTGCGTTAQNGYGAGSTIGDKISDAAAWDKITADDRQSVSSGLLPPEVLIYDSKIATLMPQAQSILAMKDKTRAREWISKIDALMKARANVSIAYSRALTARAAAIGDALGHGRPDPCLSPMGRNICASPPGNAGQRGGTHVCGAGPGPGEIQVGEAPGGQGVGAAPMCDWVR